jgi:hypothetical protein
MNWGKGIVTGMIVFMLFILSMCFYMFRMPADEYDHQYYEKGLNFDRDFNKEQQVVKDHAQPIIATVAKTCPISFTQSAKGTVKFIRPSSEALDSSVVLNTGGGNTATIPLQNLVTGRWQIVIDWTSGSKAYLYQQDIDIK